MKDLTEFVHHAEWLVKYKIETMNQENRSLLSIEQEILELLHETSSLIESIVLKGKWRYYWS